MRRREMGHIEDIRAAHGVVAILVAGIHRLHVDGHLDVPVRGAAGSQIDDGGELMKHRLEVSARLHARELDPARRGSADYVAAQAIEEIIATPAGSRRDLPEANRMGILIMTASHFS